MGKIGTEYLSALALDYLNYVVSTSKIVLNSSRICVRKSIIPSETRQMILVAKFFFKV